MMDEFRSLTGEPEMAEPLESTLTPDQQSSAAVTLNLNRKPSISSIPTAKKVFSSQTTSATSSPRPSRESSPARPPPVKPVTSTRTGPGRSRKNSSQEGSPSRASSTPNPLSSAAVQRALSAATTPQLYPSTSDLAVKAPAPQKMVITTELKDVPRWPISPRLRSPPPTNKILSGPRKTEHDLPGINVLGATPIVESILSVDFETHEALAIPGTKASARGASGASSTLETVQEMSQSTTPALEFDGSRQFFDNALKQLADEDGATEGLSKKSALKPGTGANESGSESGKGENKLRAASAAPVLASRPTVPPTKSYSLPGAGRGKPSGEGSTKNMTVETETVSSIPQVAVGGGTVGPGANASLRAKPSAETIKPKKEKKKSSRKTPTVTAGVASSKADIFEAKIASAVDEANSSDSEETFVYESNPPEASERPRRFHSRTPSATSMASQIDQRGSNVRSIQGLMDAGHNVAAKKSMKFTNSFNTNPDIGTDDDGKGTIRSTTGTGRGTAHHHHLGRWGGRTAGNGHPSLFDNESPFPNVAKSKLAGNTSRNSSQPTSPRIANSKYGNGKKNSPISSGYDVDDGADDDRTPLMSTVRLGRGGRNRRLGGSSLRQLEHQASRQEGSFMTRFAGCLVISIMMLLAVSGATAFLFATLQPLVDLKISAIKNVIASGQELIFDMDVTARNPNVMVVAIDSMSMDLFAKSKHSGPDSDLWGEPWANPIRVRDDSPWDPPFDPDDPNDPEQIPLLLIGHVSDFDSPLLFEGSPFSKALAFASGQLHISKPGNTTEPDGAERWNRLIKFEFDLILKGTLKYQLPLSQRVRSVSVAGKVTVKPSEGIPKKTQID